MLRQNLFYPRSGVLRWATMAGRLLLPTAHVVLGTLKEPRMVVPVMPVTTVYSEQDRLRRENDAIKREIDAKRIRRGLDPKHTETK